MTKFHAFPLVLLWASYALGQVLHMLKRADLGVSSKAEFFRKNRVALACRLFVATMVFVWWQSNPGFLAALAARFDVTVGIDLPINPATAGLYGFVSDSMLDWFGQKVPFLRNELPEIKNGNGGAH